MYGPDAILCMHISNVQHNVTKDPMGLLPSFPAFWCSNASDTTEGKTLYLHIATSYIYIYTSVMLIVMTTTGIAMSLE